MNMKMKGSTKNNIVYTKKYHERSGLNYQKDKLFSKAGIANIFPALTRFLYKKADDYYYKVRSELWKNFEGHKKVLDVGCGSGTFLLAAPAGHELVGTEIIDTEIEKSKEKGLNVIKANLNKKLPFEDASFDGIIMSHVIEHLENPYKTLKELKRILKDGGKLVIVTPNFATDYKNFYNDFTHKNPFTKRGLFKILFDAEFKDIKIKNDVYNSYSILFILLNVFPRFKFYIGKMICSFYGKSILAIAKL
jgi:ubiquinone/menaquinone biosynthesis C-methylase UbiE